MIEGVGLTEDEAEELHEELKPYSEMKEGYDEVKENVGDFRDELKKIKLKRAGKAVEDEKENPFEEWLTWSRIPWCSSRMPFYI